MKNNLYNLLGGGGRMVIFLITIPLLVKYMGVERYGLWVLLTSIGNIALILDAGLAGGTMFFVSEAISHKEENNNVLNKVITSLIIINVIIILIIITLFFAFHNIVFDFFFKENLDELYLKQAIIGIGFYTSLLLSHNIFIGIIQSYENFIGVNIIKFLFLFVLNFGLVVMSAYKFEFYYMVGWMILCCFLALLAYIILTLRYVNIITMKYIFDKICFIDVTKYSFNTWLGYAGNILFGQMDKIILGLVSTPYAVGVYGAIISITTYINSLATVGLQPTIPKIAKLYPDFKANRKKISDYFNFISEFNAVLIFCLALFLFPFLNMILFDLMKIDIQQDQDGAIYFFIAILIYAINSIYVPGFYALMALKETKILGKVQLFASVMALSLIYILGKRYGVLGAIIGNFGFVLTHFFNYKVSYKLTGSVLSWIKPLYKFFLCFTILAVLSFLVLDNFTLAIINSILGLCVIIYIFITRNQNEVKNLLVR